MTTPVVLAAFAVLVLPLLWTATRRRWAAAQEQRDSDRLAPWLAGGSAAVPALALSRGVLVSLLLGAYFGWVTVWVVLASLIGFLTLAQYSSRLNSRPEACPAGHPDGPTPAALLAARYELPALQPVVALVLLVTGVAAVALELMVALTLFTAGGDSSVWSTAAWGIGLATALVLHCIGKASQANVAGDSLRLLATGVGLLAVFVIISGFIVSDPPYPLARHLHEVTWTSAALPGWPFFLGVLLLYAPLPLCEGAAWHRIDPATPLDAVRLRRAIRAAGLFAAVASGLLLLSGAVLTMLPPGNPGGVEPPSLYWIAWPLIDLVRLAGDSHLGLPRSVSNALIFCLTLGLLSAFLSSARSHLLVAARALTMDLKRQRKRDAQAPGGYGSAGRVSSAVTAIALMLASLCIAVTIDPVAAVFVVFGTRVALAPLIIVALRRHGRPAERRHAAFLGLAAGSLAAASFGALALSSPADSVVHEQGPFLVPVLGFAIPFGTLMFADLARRCRRRVTGRSSQ